MLPGSAAAAMLTERGVPADVAGAFADVVLRARREELDAALAIGRPHLPRVVRTRWRLDVTIASSAVARVMRPTVLLELTLDSGAVHTISVPVDRFHELRYATARALRDLGDAEGHAVLRLAHDLERRARRVQEKDK
jgi:hypothetical protein